jgi:hypothetical protein
VPGGKLRVGRLGTKLLGFVSGIHLMMDDGTILGGSIADRVGDPSTSEANCCA